MENSDKPEMTLLQSGEHFKTLNITAKAGMIMPLHHSTKEAVIVVLSGESLLVMPDGQHKLSQGGTFIIPKMVSHSLKVVSDFHAIAVMETSSAIEFED
ncbi:cupin domain-containing protein [Aequorivita sp. H23M31]|uniref:Cupin domain-containing protein n=1 Tax=Aequorivita ciconiae TaxID=2494375 RepID=A0A410G1W3_9FLAO|nr:cupin domain-containing protein [Aequorivita sp. H23M31]QAA81254.1 cupin domain-containing protein [Aequorivita sp. H23M31]